MREIWIIARHEYLVNVRRPGFIIMTALVPVLGLLFLLAGAFSGGGASEFLMRQFSPQSGDVGIVDHSDVFSPILSEYQGSFYRYASEDAGRAALQEQAIGILLIIPEDYVATGQVLIRSTESDINGLAIADSAQMRAFFVDHLLRDRVEPGLRKRLANPVDPVLLGPNAESEPQSGPLSLAMNIIGPYVLGLLLTMTIFTSSGFLLRGLAEEKAGRVIEMILSSVTSRELLTGKVLGLGALGLTQVVVWQASAVGLLGGAVRLLGVASSLMDRPEVFLMGLLYYLLGFLVYAVLMAAVGTLGTSMQESQQLAGMFSLIAATPLMLAGILFSNPNIIWARILSWFPLTAPTMMLLRLPMADVPMVDVVGSVVVLLLTIPAVLWAGSKVFRMGLLMYGKRPTLAQVWRTLRQT